MKLDDVFERLSKNLTKLDHLEKVFAQTSEDYIDLMEKFEIRKNEIIDPNIRDSIEKQLTRAFREDSDFFELYRNVERLRREKDQVLKALDLIKEENKVLFALKDIIKN